MTVPFRRGSRPVINSIKHVIDTEGGLTSTVSVVPLAKGVGTQSDPFNPNNVVVGSRINAFYISIFIIGATGAPVTGSQNWYIARQHSGQSNSGFPDPGTTGTSLLRNQIIHQEKGLVGSGDGTAMAFKGVVVVPRGMRRMREGDNWNIYLKNNSADSATFCLQSIYKSFR